MEKINWEVPFIYKNKHYCSVAHQKFGFRIYVAQKNTKIAENTAKEIEGVIEKAIESSKSIVKNYAVEALQREDISIDNRISELKKCMSPLRTRCLQERRNWKEYQKMVLKLLRSNLNYAEKSHI